MTVVSRFYEQTSLEHRYQISGDGSFFFRVEDHFPDLVGFYVRKRFLERFLSTMREVQTKPHTILDLGSSDGLFSQFLVNENDTLICADLASHSLSRAREHLSASAKEKARSLSFVVADAGNLPFSDEAFDILICTEVIEHLLDVQQALGELHRILKPGGVLYLTTPNKAGTGLFYGPLKYLSTRLGLSLKEHRPVYKRTQEAEQMYGMKSHVREFLPRELEDLLNDGGFCISISSRVFVTYLDLQLLSKLTRGLDRVLCAIPLVRLFAGFEHLFSALLPSRGFIQVCVAKKRS
jgi:ubiquinone/menaquinone biosynthesis C-methylase UbiE